VTHLSQLKLSVTNSETSLEQTLTGENLSPTQESEQAKEDSMKEYYQLKQTLLVGTLGITAGCFALVWTFYSLNVALNYLLGACFSLVYLNMLTREVERIGTAKRRIGSTRLGLFVGLIIVVTQFQQLKIIPIFLGFLTYKATVLFYILPYSLIRSVK
jgi:ATP synthase protein I